ncbi:hypothetical protein E2C01_049843 [Portunus trituberculatus]|uniref:Uncharacterized protein n=1 Tax=Portunus trituberculatus TaxID=210409 RepID=A0A5B7GFE9_PORTR|nr:hypothetical protein [Portunus trituberculatus]
MTDAEWKPAPFYTRAFRLAVNLRSFTMDRLCMSTKEQEKYLTYWISPYKDNDCILSNQTSVNFKHALHDRYIFHTFSPPPSNSGGRAEDA